VACDWQGIVVDRPGEIAQVPPSLEWPLHFLLNRALNTPSAL
jgi:hypothetical protein